MAYTNLDVINGALRELNVIAENQNASPEQGKQCLEKLNELMEMWREVGVDFGWFEQSSTAGNAPIPLAYRTAVRTNLAIVCASQYGASVSQELATVADRTYNFLLSKTQREQLENVNMRHMPSGSGKYGDKGYDITTDS
jgi:hypothetical protein